MKIDLPTQQKGEIETLHILFKPNNKSSLHTKSTSTPSR